MTSAEAAWPARTETAPAKLNLTLRILGRRADGYHLLSSLVAFADLGERLTLAPSHRTSLEVTGPFSGALGEGENLVRIADRAFRDRFPGRLGGIVYRLDKHIPVAAGLGGGSADAAAALRGLARLAGADDGAPDLAALAAGVGADVPVCLGSRAALVGGIGERVRPLGVTPPFAALLVNPGIGVATRQVFAALGNVTVAAGTAGDPDAPPGTVEELRAAVMAGGNDLEGAARRIAPVIGEVLEAIAATPDCRLARISGSGATCFGLFDTLAAAERAVKEIRGRRPQWWARAARLG